MLREEKRRAAAHVLRYQVCAPDAELPDVLYASRHLAEEECTSYRRRGIAATVRCVHAPLPGNPWLGLHS